MSKIFKFPEINEEFWKDFKSGSVPKNKAREMIEKGLQFLIDIQLLQKSSFLTEEVLGKSMQKAREVSKSLEELKERHNLTVLIQNLLGRKIEEMTKEENDGDIQTSFNRLEVLTLEAHAHDSLLEHSKESIDAIYRENEGMINSYLIKINVFDHKTRTTKIRYFLPTDWTIKTQKMTAWHLRNLRCRTTTRWMEKKGIDHKKREVPVETPEPEKKELKKTPPDSESEKPKLKPKEKSTTKTSEKKDGAEIKKVNSIKEINQVATN